MEVSVFLDSDILVNKIVEVLDDKKARDISMIDIKSVSTLADYFVIASGTSTTHIKALADELDERLQKDEGLKYRHREGYNNARWILLDYGEVVVHIFHEEDRSFYNLERLWQDGVISHL